MKHAAASPVILSQLKPFSAGRFDLCMGHLMREHRRTLNQHDLVKLHVMTDFFHVLESGKQAIGGSLQPWKHGPVVKEGYNRVGRLKHLFDEGGDVPVSIGGLRVVGRSGEHGNRYSYEAVGPVDAKWLSPLELQSMKRAWDLIMSLTFREREDFFHGDGYMGRVWQAAGGRDAPRDARIDWGDLITAYDRAHPDEPDHELAHLMIDVWRGDG